METFQEQEFEDSYLPPLVREHLLTIPWGAEVYPTELLELNSNEQNVLSQINEGASMKGISLNKGIALSAAYARYHTALGKIEAMGGLENDILDLPPLGKRVVVLNSIFGSAWNRGNSALIALLPEGVIEKSRQLTELLGDKWQRCPQICTLPIETLNARIAAYDKALSPNWRSNPIILTLNPQAVEQKAATYDSWFGDTWRTKPTLLTNTPSTVISSARALETIGITANNTRPGTYFGLLATSVANKRRKALFIRRELLGHQQIYLHDDKKRISAIVQERRKQTLAEKKVEAEEIEECVNFIRHIGAKGLIGSTDVIRAWAQAHGYIGDHKT